MSEQAPELRTEANRRKAEALLYPDSYAEHELGIRLHPKQAAVLRDLFPRKGQSRVSFRCANEVGKTSHVAATAILYALDILNAQVISTAGVWMQVESQLIPALKKHQHHFPSWRFLDSSININGVDRYVGFSTKNEGFAQGFHRQAGMPLLAIIDEAAAVADVIYNGVEDRCNPDYLLIMGSPLDPQGMFYRIETELAKFYTHHHLSQLDCLEKDGYWIAESTIERKVAKWKGKDNPFIQSNVYGEFAKRVANALLSLGEFEYCKANQPDWHHGHNDRHAFIDFAAGRDKNVFAVRVGNKVWIEKKWTERDTMATVGECLAIFRKLKRDYGLREEEVEADADGLGIGLIHRLREVGLAVKEFHGNTAPEYDPQNYSNAISETWHEGAGKIISQDIILPLDEDFRGQILTRQSKRNSTGKFQLESKEDMKKRGLDSPDEADAILRAMMPTVNHGSSSLVSNQEPEESRGWVKRGMQERNSDCVLPGESCL